MTVELDKEQSKALFHLYVTSCTALKLNRSKKRKVMRIGNKFHNAGSKVKLKPAEIQFTLNLLITHFHAMQRALVEMKIEKLDQKEEIEILHQLYYTLYELLVGVVKNEAA